MSKADYLERRVTQLEAELVELKRPGRDARIDPHYSGRSNVCMSNEQQARSMVGANFTRCEGCGYPRVACDCYD